ncbi:MAG: hypothetical protein A4E57_01199 [Syntrophorhabdaceae bacterium PtaU1.Bin034]|nr:MAG: hypothetical protein A4E57_01199 [Syntrophorhabdaceae bacterium PtaU1.Bin034]
MPLAFNSLSHGEIAFGFFNIETDLLIMDSYFMFASDFCEWTAQVAECLPGHPVQMNWSVYALREDDIGSLMGAIHGIEMRGFIGDVYRKFPFPKEVQAFAQNPEGDKNRNDVRKIIEQYAQLSEITAAVDETGATIEIGDYMFSREEFHNLLQYVWVGGYPYWKMGRRPAYVLKMRERIEASRHPLFHDITFI